MAFWGQALTAGLGALAGSMGQGQSQTSSVQLAPPSESELAAGRVVTQGLPDLQNLVNAGPGQGAQINANASNAQLAVMLQQFSQGGYLPSQQDFQQGNQFAQSAFAPQQVALNQAFDEEKQRASQLAAQLGRPVNDPIIQAKLSQERMRGQERLGAQQSAFASEFAMSQPQQRLGYTAQLADIQQGLASQAMQNRQALIGLGSQIQGQGQSFRAGTATRTQTGSGGGGLAGAIMGGLAGWGAGANLGNTTPNTTDALKNSAGLSGQSGASSGFGLGNYSFGTPSLSSAASGFGSQLANFSTQAMQSTYRGALSPNAPNQMPTNDFGAFGMMGSNSMGDMMAPYRPAPPNPYGSTYGITPR